MAPPRLSKAEWAAKNPPRAGETREQYKQRYQDETEPTLLESGWSALGDAGRGAIAGGFKGLGSTVRAIGDLTGSRTLKSGGRDMESLADAYAQATMDDPEGMAGKAGQLVGRGGFEVATSLGGASAVGKGLLKVAPKVAQYLPRLAKGMQYVGEGAETSSALRRALSTAAINAPVDIVQGTGAEEGMVLPGKSGAIAENVLFSLGGGAASGILDARRAAKGRYRSAEDVGPFQASGLPDHYNYGPYEASPIPTRAIPAQTGGPYYGGNPPERVFYMGGEIASPPRKAEIGKRVKPSLPVYVKSETPEQEAKNILRMALSTSDDALSKMYGGSSAAAVRNRLIQNAERHMRSAKLSPGQMEELAAAADVEARALRTSAAAEDASSLSPEELATATRPSRVRPARASAARVRTSPLKDSEAIQDIIDGFGAGAPLSNVERRSARVRPAKITARRGEIDPTLLSTLGGSAAGGITGVATGDEDSDPMVRALVGALIGSGAGYGASRFFVNGATPRAPRTETVEQLTRGVERGDIKPPKMASVGMSPFPENRVPLVERSGVDPSQRVALKEVISKIEPPVREWSPSMGEKEFYRRVEGVLGGEQNPSTLSMIDPRRATPEEAGAVLALHRDARKQIMDRVEQFKRTTDPDEIARLTDEIDLLENNANGLLAQVIKMDRAAGQSLATRRFMAKEITDPTYWHIKGARLKKGEFLSLDEKAQIDKLMAEGNTEKLLQYMASLQKSSTLEQLASLRAAGLLTAVPGRLRDLISTSTNYAATALQRFGGAGVDALIAKAAARKLGGAADQYRSVAMPTTAEFKAALAGGKEGLARAAESMGFGQKSLAEWAEFMRNAELDPDMIRQLDIPHQVNIDFLNRFGKGGEKASGVLDLYAKTVMRSSGVTDKIIRGAALQGALTEQVRLEGMRRGLKGTALQDFVATAMKNPDAIDDELKLNAALTANYITFTNDGKLADMISNAIELASSRAGRDNPENAALVRAAARFIAPFRRTPANILSRAMEYAPGTGQVLAVKSALDWNRELASAALKGTAKGTALAAKQRKLVERLTKQATGLGMFALGAHLYRNGVLTGEAPESQAEQEQWRLEGRQPESLLLNGQWVPIARISPFGGMMTMAASIMQNAEANGMDADAGGALDAAMASPLAAGQTVARSLLNQPMVTGPKETLDALTNRRMEQGQSFGQNMAGSLVPSFLAQAARAEGRQRLPQSVGQAITSRIPGLQETAPERLNIFGEPVQKAGGLVNNLVNPMTATRDQRTQDPLVAELAAVRANVPAMKRKTGESMEMYQYRQREAGAFVKEDLTALVQSDEYRAATPDEKRRMIMDTVTRARRDFDNYLKETFAITPEE